MSDTAMTERTETANERFKRRFADTLWASVCVAVIAHALVLALFPSMSVADVSFSDDPLETIELPEDLEIPPQPEEIARPAMPIVSDFAPDDAIIPDTRLDTDPLERPMLAPPVTREGTEEARRVDRFTPMTVKPELKNRSEVARELERRYPRLLRESGIGGAPVIWFYIDEQGVVQRTELKQTSGYPTLDEAALAVARVMRFSPARNFDRIVAVWVYQPITFESK
jgi:protein TonB